MNDFSEKTSASTDQPNGDTPTDGTATDELKAAHDRYLRLAAEFENYKRRAQKDQADYVKYANERILKDLLTVLDNLQRALQHAQQPHGINSLAGDGQGLVQGLVQGVELTCKQYVEALSRFGVTEIPSVGRPFDPVVHQAVAMVKAVDGQTPNTVVTEHAKGYYLHERVLRPAMVTVAGPNQAAEN